MAPKNAEFPAFGLILIRIVVGVSIASAGFRLIGAGVDADVVLERSEAIEAAPALFAWWGEAVLLGFPGFFAFLLAWGQALGGMALVVGVLVRPVGALLAFTMLNIYFAGSADPAEPARLALILATCCVALAASGAGRVFGFDRGLDATLPSWLTWSNRRRSMFD
jgi:uncharacterized membrane protein YphA (DoxX/SURF4 family)